MGRIIRILPANLQLVWDTSAKSYTDSMNLTLQLLHLQHQIHRQEKHAYFSNNKKSQKESKQVDKSQKISSREKLNAMMTFHSEIV